MKLIFEINNLLYMKIPTPLKISKKLANLPTIKLSDVHDLQGEFKDLSTQNFERLASLIEKHGFKYPLYIWQNPKDNLFYNLDGNQRQRVLETLYGNEIELPFVEVEAKNAKEAKKQILALNSNFGTVTKDGFDFLTADFDADDFLEIKTDFTFENFLDIDIQAEVLETEGDDDIPELPAEPFVVRGDIFEINANGVKIRIGCLDSCNSDDIEKLMVREKAEIAFTSPPYNAGQTPSEAKNNKKSKYENFEDNKNEKDYLQFLTDFTNNSLLFSEYSFVNIQSLAGNKIALIDYLYNLKSLYADTIIWNKQNSQPAMAENVLNSQFEYIHIFSQRANRSIGTKKFRGTLKNIIDIQKQNKNEIKEHNATFSVEFALYFTENFCEKSVLDLFCGTGTTAIACLKTKRNCFTNDISENYVQVAVKRCIDFCEKNNMPFEITLNGESFNLAKLV